MTTVGRHVEAELLFALWRLGGDEALPPDGTLDRALERLGAALPAPLSGLSFATTAVGRRCLDLDDLTAAASDMMLVEHDGTTFTRARVTLGEGEAAGIVAGHGMRVAHARELGRALRNPSG